MEIVSFKVAKAIKDAGYPQGVTWHFYEASGRPNTMYGILRSSGYDAPTYFEVWLWLWREKGIAISLQLLSYPCIGWAFSIECISTSHPKLTIYDSQEEALRVAIDYLAENNLINSKMHRK